MGKYVKKKENFQLFKIKKFIYKKKENEKFFLNNFHLVIVLNMNILIYVKIKKTTGYFFFVTLKR